MEKIENKDLKFFGIVWCAVLSVLGILQYLKGHFLSYKIHLAIGVFALTAAYFKPVILKPLMIVLRTLWWGFVWCVTTVTLVVFYYLVITPIGFIIRLSGKDILDEKIDKTCEGYWVDRKETTMTKESLERQF